MYIAGSLFILMHGAGAIHISHAALGVTNKALNQGQPCCGLIELFPDKSIDFYTIHG